MTYEDIATMSLEDMEAAIKELLYIATAVSILGEGMPISGPLAKLASKYSEVG